jgi:hypothetical protein
MSRRKRTFHKPDRGDARYDRAVGGHVISLVLIVGLGSVA